MSPGTMSLRTLVVDDDPDTADALGLLLRKLGNEVQVSYDGLSAVEAARVFMPDLALLDLAMPRFDGIALAKRLRDLPELKQTRLVAVTGYCDPHHRQMIDAAGFDEFLAKPCSLQELRQMVERARRVRAESDAIHAASEQLRAESQARREELNELYEWSRLLIERSRSLSGRGEHEDDRVTPFLLAGQEYELIAAHTVDGFHAAWTCETCQTSGLCQMHSTSDAALDAAEEGARQHHHQRHSQSNQIEGV